MVVESKSNEKIRASMLKQIVNEMNKSQCISMRIIIYLFYLVFGGIIDLRS